MEQQQHTFMAGKCYKYNGNKLDVIFFYRHIQLYRERTREHDTNNSQNVSAMDIKFILHFRIRIYGYIRKGEEGGRR